MASSYYNSAQSSSSSWTPRENKLFEQALARYDRETPDRWQNIAKVVGKPVAEVKRQYEKLVVDVNNIESDRYPIPNYR